MNRGELWAVAGGTYASKPRPALILQEDLFDATESVTVVPLTTTVVDAPLIRIPVPSTRTTGIERPSFAMVDKITTVRRTNVSERIGRLPASLLVDIERAALLFLGLAR
ncbi:type II toxin-antitoxin system PemK/MazF family toxin [Mumia sp. zg.B53]|uniref:type II toxin-antitoxin system PemK/MazF family toxin n=2 Tax=Mumia TaxID=1546255 RepID=UPI001C6EDF20|nr:MULTISPECIES: type II toxin-antitoxin system PemK/MazF family toxin [unclassified Mumia]MBW9207569.1 type II toxin-antitoxin system PemK/MazF family toxin [Mumia sp. zg.B17]MBW9214689.1 type II toxin-antitoxin system PemK/MazF family toxin [Mumia sp. zg.B53]